MRILCPVYYEKFKQHVKASMMFPDCPPEYEAMLKIMESPHTKRMMFDPRQAAVFAESEPVHIPGEAIKPPFDQFYMEFGEPIEVPGTEPGFVDKLVAIMVVHDACDLDTVFGDRTERIKGTFVGMLFVNEVDPKNPEKIIWVDRGFRMSIEHKVALCAAHNARNTPFPSEVPQEWKPTTYFASEVQLEGWPDRKVGWWEKTIQSYADLVLWICSYTMAKSVRVVEETMTRQQRRWHERNNTVPRPWHHVYVEPKYVKKDVAPTEGEGSSHSYRYDVIGHLRFSKFTLSDGSVRHVVSWVNDHQRGLKNELYVPKTYVVKGGKKPLPEMTQYWGVQKIPTEKPKE